MPLFQFAVVLNPTKKEEKDGKPPKVVVDVETVWAKGADAARLLAARSIPEEHTDKLDRLEVAVRPF